MTDTEELLQKAEAGDNNAQYFVSEGYAFGLFGFEQSHKKLIDCAEKNWGFAQSYVSRGYAYGIYGFDPEPDKLRECAEKGWGSAQRYFILGYAVGENEQSIVQRAWNKLKSIWT